MKIMHIISSLNIGGVETLLLDVCENIKDSNLDSVIVYNKEGSLSSEFQKTKAKLIKITPMKYSKDRIKFILQLRKIIKKEKPDLIHAHFPNYALFTYFAAIGLKIKKVFTLHGDEPRYYNSLRFVVSRMDATIFVSKSFLQTMIKKVKLNIKKPFVLNNGINFNSLNNKEKKLKQELGLSEKSILVGMVGRFSSEKDPLTICRSIGILTKNYKNIYLVFIGPKSPHEPHIYDNCLNYCEKNNIKDKVFFIGERRDISNILNSLDIFVLSSFNESFGKSLVEAMFMKVPCIASNIPPFLELSENGKYSFIFKTKNETDLALKIEQIINLNQTKKNNFTEEAKKYVLNKFSIEKQVEGLINIYNTLLSKK
jgi:L-malate glycosyltransferase